MVREHICDVLLFTLISLACGAEKCIFETESGNKSACCADFEASENGCVACSIGYTSDRGQNCRPCQNSYGKRCEHDCYCSDLEICNIVEGCVFPSTKMLEHGTSNTTNLPRILDETASEKSIENSQGLLFRDIILYYTLSVSVAVFGICICLNFYKRKRVTKMRNSTIIKSTNRTSPQNCHIMEMEEPAYEIIEDSDTQQVQMQIPPKLHDVISLSNSRGSHGSQESVNLEHVKMPLQFQPSAKTKRHEGTEDCIFYISDDNIPSSFEDNQETTKTHLTACQ